MQVGSDAAPAGGRRTLLPHSGGAGAQPGGTMTPCEELADGGPLRLARGSKDKAAQKAASVSEPEAGRNGASESAARRRNDVAMARREAPHLRKKV
jgi:hypothetical protein